MPATIHTGSATSHEPGAVADNIRFVTAGLPFNDALEASNPGLRDAFTFDFVSYNPAKDVRGRQKDFGFEFKSEITLEDTRFAHLKNIMWRCASSLQDIQFHWIGGSSSMGWVTLKNNAAALSASATGSASVAFGMEYSVTNTENTLKVMMNGAMTKKEQKWIYSNSAAADPGNSGGTSQGQAANTYSYANKLAPGISAVTITNSGGAALIGRVGLGSKLSIKSLAGAPDSRNRALAQKFEFTADLEIMDFNKDQLAAFVDDGDEDVIVSIALLSGQTILASIGASSVTAEPHGEESPGKSMCKVKLMGEIILGATISATTYCDIGIGDANVLSFVLVGYN